MSGKYEIIWGQQGNLNSFLNWEDIPKYPGGLYSTNIIRVVIPLNLLDKEVQHKKIKGRGEAEKLISTVLFFYGGVVLVSV